MKLELGTEALRPLVEEVVRAVMAEVHNVHTNKRADGRLAYSESEAAAMLGLQRHQLRDERLRGRIASSTVMGGRIRYLPEDLEAYLLSRRRPATTT
jgi:hypothetical protein